MANLVRTRRIFYVLNLALLSGCSWVDDTGRQSNTTPDISLDDSNLLTEGATLIWPLQNFDADRNIASLRFEQIASGASVDSCSGDFSPLVVAETLREACQPSLSDEQCVVTFDVGAKDVTVSLPELRRPAALSYQVLVQDEDGATDTQTVDLCIASVSEAPVAVNDDHYAVSYLGELEHSGSRYDAECVSQGGTGVLANDTDDFDYSEGWDSGQNCLRVTLVDAPVYAESFELGEDGSFSYHSSGAAGPGSTDSFTYRVSDGQNDSELATVTIAIIGDNELPVALNPTLSTEEDATLSIALTQLANDPEGTALQVESFTQPRHGTVQIESSGLSFIPEASYSGTTRFSVVLVDAAGLSVESQVEIRVIAVNDKPIITGFPSQLRLDASVADAPTEFEWSFSVADEETESSSLALAVQISDDVASVRLQGPTASGEVTLLLTPLRDGQAVVSLQVSDMAQGALAAETTEISASVVVTGVDQAPIAVDDTAELFKGGTLTVAVLENDSDPDGEHESLRISEIITQPEFGDVSIVNSGRALRYVSNSLLSVEDRVVYQVIDPQGMVAEAELVLTVANRAPIVLSESRDLPAVGIVSTDVLSNDSDPDGDQMTLVVGSDGYVGSAAVLNGLLFYQAPANFTGTVNIPYEVHDGDGGIGQGVLTLTSGLGG